MSKWGTRVMLTNVALLESDLLNEFPSAPSRLSSLRERMLARVSRWAIVPTIQRQSVAEHSFFVALMATRLAAVIRWKATNQDMFHLSRYALLHDSLEAVTGDLPTPIKKHLKELSKAEHALLSETTNEFRKMRNMIAQHAQPWLDISALVGFADSLEALAFLHTEHMLGNRAVTKVAAEIRARVDREWKNLPFGDAMTDDEKRHLWEQDILPVIDGREQQWPTVA